MNVYESCRTHSLPPALDCRPPSPLPPPRLAALFSSRACHTTSLHAGKGFIEIYSCLHLYIYTHTPGMRACLYGRMYRAYVRMRLCTVRSGVASRAIGALTRSQPSQVYARVELYYQSTRRAYNLIRAVGRRRESSRKFCAALRCVAQSRPSGARSNRRRRVCATSAWRGREKEKETWVKRQVISRPVFRNRE